MLDAIGLSVFVNRLGAVCDEMGAVLRRSAFSPNIKDRLDYSCAVFDADGRLCAQAAHIPVHLGSMAYAMADLVKARSWQAGDMLIVNDPYLGGTHLPDVTLVAPVFHDSRLLAFAANRAHHADIGCASPGSMPLATRLQEEGLVIAPRLLQYAGTLDQALFEELLRPMRNATLAGGDFMAQVSANRCAVERLAALIDETGPDAFSGAVEQLNRYAERLVAETLAALPDGRWAFTDFMDDDGQGQTDIPISVAVTIDQGRIEVDFTGTGAQVAGNINCPFSVTAAAVYYVFYCLMPDTTPPCSGSFRPITISAPRGTLVNAERPAAVAGGNVETSTRIVDALLGALAQALPERIPAASQGSMNNVALGAATWTYYETLAGGTGASPRGRGLDAVQSHMTNTKNTPVEVLEMSYPLRIRRYAVRRGSGGDGRHRGGCGLLREYEFLEPARITVLAERRRRPPWGLAGGEPGARAETRFNGEPVAGKVALDAGSGDHLLIATAGGGGWGAPRGTV